MRIRNTKPEFWRSKRVAERIPDWGHRYVLKALESYVDDNGVGKDDLALIVADCFSQDVALDPSRVFKRVKTSIEALFEAGFIHRYEVSGDNLLFISWWESTQYVNRPKDGRFPRPDGTWSYGESEIGPPDLNSQEASRACSAVLGNQGIRESGNQGTSSSHLASEDDGESDDSDSGPSERFPDHVIELCNHLAEHIQRNGNRVGTVGVTWWKAMDRLIRIDDYTPDQVRQVIDWSQQNEFWQGNILSAPKLREKFDQLKTKMFAERNQAQRPPQQHMSAADRAMQRGAERHQRMADYRPTSWDDVFTQQQIEGGSP